MRLVFRNAKSRSSNNQDTRDDDSKETMGNTGESEDGRREGEGWDASTLYRLASGNASYSLLQPRLSRQFSGGGEKYGVSQSDTIADARILRDLT